MASKCFSFASEIRSIDSVINEGTFLMAVIIVYGIYADNKKPVSNFKRMPATQNNVFVAAEEFKELDDSSDIGAISHN